MPWGRSRNHRVTLECKFKNVTFDNTRMKLRAFNDQVPGAADGGLSRTEVARHREEFVSAGMIPPAGMEITTCRIFDSTNIHVHGMDVIPHLFEPFGTADPELR